MSTKDLLFATAMAVVVGASVNEMEQAYLAFVDDNKQEVKA